MGIDGGGEHMGVLSAFDLTGRVAVVTGGNRGLGEAFTHALAQAGATVVVAARDAEKSDDVVEAVRIAGGSASAIRLDVVDPGSIEAAHAALVAEHGGVDVLVNNAGVCYHRPALEVPEAEWRSVFDINVDGLWQCSRIFGAHMVERGSGVITNVGSISAQIVNRPQWQPAYNASKAAVHQLTKSLAAEWAPYGVRVNALAPGYVRTEMAPVDDPRFKPRWIDDVPMQRAAEPQELGPTMVWMCSDASSFMTGSVVVVDGGYTLH
jgi:NAD(P)-dependent dehydrogenase (short-subunit alcohol dehydrogenase family)